MCRTAQRRRPAAPTAYTPLGVAASEDAHDEARYEAGGEPGDTRRCAVDGCDREWPRDPVLEVACPEPDCGAGVGAACVERRPSGHVNRGAFAGLPDWGHDARELLADATGCYGVCPLGRCGQANKARREAGAGVSAGGRAAPVAQGSLFN